MQDDSAPVLRYGVTVNSSPGLYLYFERLVTSHSALCRSLAAVPVRAAEPAGERPADGGGARQAVQQHPGDRLPAHVPVEPGHAARPGEGQEGPGAARPHRPAAWLQDGQSQPHYVKYTIYSTPQLVVFVGRDSERQQSCFLRADICCISDARLFICVFSLPPDSSPTSVTAWRRRAAWSTCARFSGTMSSSGPTSRSVLAHTPTVPPSSVGLFQAH